MLFAYLKWYTRGVSFNLHVVPKIISNSIDTVLKTRLALDRTNLISSEKGAEYRSSSISRDFNWVLTTRPRSVDRHSQEIFEPRCSHSKPMSRNLALIIGTGSKGVYIRLPETDPSVSLWSRGTGLEESPRITRSNSSCSDLREISLWSRKLVSVNINTITETGRNCKNSYTVLVLNN